jgi:hypothetical protein
MIHLRHPLPAIHYRPGASWKIACLLSLLCALLAGCKTHSVQTPNEPASIDELNLLAMPVGVNLDNLPGADGFAIKVYAASRTHPKPVRISSGTLEVLMYDGVVAGSDMLAKTPLRVWSFQPGELASHETTTSIGVGYNFTQAWETTRPASNRITVTARHISTAGKILYAAPSSISVFGP